MKSAIAFLAAWALLLVGCSGNGENQDFRGGVMGIIFDEEGLPVRDANVYFDASGSDSRTTRTNSNGVYVLEDLPTGDRIIRAEATSGSGVRFFGSNVARIQRGERTMNHNIAIYRDDRLASIEGFVFDREGNGVVGARVFVKQVAENTVLSSAYGITNDEGRYVVGALRSGMEYDVQVNALDFNSDFDAFTLASGERRRMDFTMPFAEDVTLTPPTGVFATAWTSPPVTRDVRSAQAVLNMKTILKPGYKPMKSDSRETPSGGVIEIDVLWNPIFDNALLGYGIYRAQNVGQLRDIYFLRDPLAEIFADMDSVLQVGQRYTYRVTSISTIGNESDFSDAASAVPLGDLRLRSHTGNSRPTFRWDPAQGADEYAVYLFADYPSVGVSPIWSNEDAPTTGTSFEYDGSALGAGTYYYIVSGMSSEGHFTISRVGELNVP